MKREISRGRVRGDWHVIASHPCDDDDDVGYIHDILVLCRGIVHPRNGLRFGSA